MHPADDATAGAGVALLNELGTLRETELDELRLSKRFEEETAIVTVHDRLYEHRAIDCRLSEVHVAGE